MESTIILIGPMSAGKSTIGELLAKKLDLPHYSLDVYRWDYYREIGYDEAEASKIAHSDQGMLGLLAHWKPYEAHAVERFLADHQLAKMIVYTNDMTPQETCAEIVQHLGKPGPGWING